MDAPQGGESEREKRYSTRFTRSSRESLSDSGERAGGRMHDTESALFSLSDRPHTAPEVDAGLIFAYSKYSNTICKYVSIQEVETYLKSGV